LDLLAQGAAQLYRNAELEKYPLVNTADLMNWLNEEATEKAELTPAAASDVRAAIVKVYDDAEKAGTKPPNIKEVVKPVQSRLEKLGYRVSGRQIQNAAKSAEFANRRRAVGKRFT
jgi:hypothetical protein